MKHIATLLAAMLLTLLSANIYAQKKADNDYNLKKAYEVLNDEKDEAKALELVNKQLRETPDNVDALMLRMKLYRSKKDYGLALQDINHVLKVNKPKKTDLQTSAIHWWKAYIYNDMGDKNNELASLKTAYELAKKDNRDNLQNISFDYAQALYDNDDLAGADVIYRNMLKENEADQTAMIGLARNLIDRKQYQEAIEELDKCQRYDADYAEIYRFKLRAYRRMGEDTKAIDAAMDWLDKNSDADFEQIITAAKKRPNYAEAQMKSRAKKSESPIYWKALLCRFYEGLRRYPDAIRLYDELENDYGRDNHINLYRSDAYYELGLIDKAIEDISKAMEKEPDWYILSTRGNYYTGAGEYEKAIADYTAAIEDNPSSSFPYYRRGWCYELMGNKAKALEEYNMGIDMQEEYAYLYLMRGELLLEQGNELEAKADFEKVLQLDTLVDDNSCRMYALHFLGKDEEAKEWMDKIIADDPDNSGNYYDKACLYARMGDSAGSIAALRSAFEKGFRRFSHIEHDDDLDSVRELPEFKELIREYKEKHEAFLKDNDITVPDSGESLTEIDFKRHNGGTFEIPCDINGLALQMIFDTGASDVTISSVEANFMFKNGYLSEKDIKGKRYYQVANGQINEGTVITLREVKIGDVVLKNVDASVVKSQKAPLLLGQSAMERFGTITIDNQNNKLIIKH